MKWLDLTLPTPAENLACDEALLDWCELENHGDILRFWEPREHFVVVGYANRVAREVNTVACASGGIPVLRRCSGGGAVLQGPGCLNYSLVLRHDESPRHNPEMKADCIISRRTTNNQHPTTNNQHPTTNNQQPTSNNQQPTSNNQQPTSNNQQPTTNIQQPTTNIQQPTTNIQQPTSNNQQPTTNIQQPTTNIQSLLGSISAANRFIMERNRAAIDSLSGTFSPHPSTFSLSICGHTDLAIGGLKFSGNAQRRRKRFLLFHGTFLLNFDISLMEKALPAPSRQPDYRRNRTHREFLTNLAVSPDLVKRALRDAWQADGPVEHFPRENILLLARDKYMTAEWNFRF